MFSEVNVFTFFKIGTETHDCWMSLIFCNDKYWPKASLLLLLRMSDKLVVSISIFSVISNKVNLVRTSSVFTAVVDKMMIYLSCLPRFVAVTCQPTTEHSSISVQHPLVTVRSPRNGDSTFLRNMVQKYSVSHSLPNPAFL